MHFFVWIHFHSNRMMSNHKAFLLKKKEQWEIKWMNYSKAFSILSKVAKIEDQPFEKAKSWRTKSSKKRHFPLEWLFDFHITSAYTTSHYSQIFDKNKGKVVFVDEKGHQPTTLPFNFFLMLAIRKWSAFGAVVCRILASLSMNSSTIIIIRIMSKCKRKRKRLFKRDEVSP